MRKCNKKQNTHANSRKTGNMITIIIHSGFLYMYFLDEDMVPGQCVVSYTYCYNVQCLWFHVNMFCCGFCWYRSKNICIANLLLSCICIHDEKLRVCAYTKAAGNVDFTTYKYTLHYTSIIMLNCKPSHMCFFMSLIASMENSPYWCQLLAPTPPDLWSHARTQQQKYHFVKKKTALWQKLHGRYFIYAKLNMKAKGITEGMVNVNFLKNDNSGGQYLCCTHNKTGPNKTIYKLMGHTVFVP